jgi:hypothetical protein
VDFQGFEVIIGVVFKCRDGTLKGEGNEQFSISEFWAYRIRMRVRRTFVEDVCAFFAGE